MSRRALGSSKFADAWHRTRWPAAPGACICRLQPGSTGGWRDMRSGRSASTATMLNPRCGGWHKGVVMKGFVPDIEDLAVKNDEFRRVLYTAKHCQLVVMALKPQEEIGAEVHTLDQFFRVEAGTGEAILDGVRTAIRAGFAVVVPAGATHNIINTGTTPLKLYTLYAPPNHRDGVVHHTRDDAEADSEHFDGQTTE